VDSTEILQRKNPPVRQAKKELQREIDELQEMLNTVRYKTNNHKYKPRIAYLLVNTKPQSKMFEREGKGENPSFVNPQPGAVTFEPLARDSYRELHLASVEVRERRCSPVCYRIGYENWEHELALLAELTCNQCHAYFNWRAQFVCPPCCRKPINW
jgi:hypothetical protein